MPGAGDAMKNAVYTSQAIGVVNTVLMEDLKQTANFYAVATGPGAVIEGYGAAVESTRLLGQVWGWAKGFAGVWGTVSGAMGLAGKEAPKTVSNTGDAFSAIVDVIEFRRDPGGLVVDLIGWMPRFLSPSGKRKCP